MERSSRKNHATLFAVILGTLAGLLVVLGPKAVVKAQGAGSRPNVVYVESNISTTNGNTVLGFSNDGAGNLTPLPGSPYLTDGTGVVKNGNGVQTDADGELIVNSAGTLLFAVNEHSNTVAVFNINSDGSLSAAPGSPTASGGQAPASLGLRPLSSNTSVLVVVNKDADINQTGGTPNYTTFNVQSNGAMTLNAGSTFNLVAGTAPAQAIPFHNESKFFGIGFLANTITSYQISANGSMSQLNVATPPGASPQTLGGVLHPTKPVLYVGLPNQSQVAVYTFDSAGNLTFRTEVADPGSAVCWAAINKNGSGLYTAEFASGTITVFNINSPTNPVQLQHFALAQVGGVQAAPTNLAFDPSGKFLYVVDADGALHVLHVSAQGRLSEPSAPVSLGLSSSTIPLGLAALQVP
ncbi:MAG TPA: beta-propeller fold lactonase family protein [Terriglobia bacterium]|nr:beta-propeller fold lactonase family protein [Terriglobia bacterium]